MLSVYRFHDLSAWCDCWFVVYIKRFIYKCVSFCLHGCCGEWECWVRKPVKPVAVVTSTDRPKWVRNRYVIRLFGGVSCII